MAFGFFKKKKKETADERYIRLTIKDVVQVAEDAVNVIFEKNEDIQYLPGQFLTIIDVVNGQKLRRAYSLCTTPDLDQHPAVTVKRVPGGQMSNHINDHYEAGQEISVMKPMGMFTTTYSASQKRKLVFIGGGSGITPLYSILRTALNREPGTEVALIYGNRNPDHIIFRQELDKLKSDHGGRFQLTHILEEDHLDIANHVGRPTLETIASAVKAAGGDDQAEYYICGPQPMMDIAVAGLKSIAIPDGQINLESFEAGKTAPAIATDAEPTTSDEKSQVTFIMDGEEYLVEVDNDTPVLDAGLDENIDLPYSCQSGLCTACRAKCLEGAVSLDDAEALTDREKEEGYVLMCVGKPRSPQIKLEVG